MGTKWRGYKRPTLKLDYETGEVIERYNSVREAAKANFVDYTGLVQAIKKRNGKCSMLKLRFAYEDEFEADK
ncbi:MAG: hypothetical protein E7231_00325 [Cellulosilyticum sp.]|nr:hypothetical protein [Cellulosilyticum sp.]